jgi:hypothetical protein
MLIFWLINIFLWVAFATYNYAFLTKKLDFHIWGAVVAFIVAIAFSVVCWLDLTFTEIFALPFISLSIRWVVYDITLNLLMGKAWWYYGSITKGFNNSIAYLKNGYLDQTFGWKQIPVKFVLIIGIIFLSL